MPEPILKPSKSVISKADIEGELAKLTPRLKAISPGVFILLSETPTSLLGPSMLNDECPVASALKVRLGGNIVRKPADLQGVAFGNAIHTAYANAVREWNPGWTIEAGGKRSITINHDGLDLNIGFEPDILLGYNNEWHLVEVKSSKHQPSHEVQLALYWLFLRNDYDIKAGWLVTYDAVLKYNPSDLAKLARIGLDYLASVARVLASWEDSGPRVSIHGNCPCRWAPICPIWQKYSLARFIEP